MSRCIPLYTEKLACFHYDYCDLIVVIPYFWEATNFTKQPRYTFSILRAYTYYIIGNPESTGFLPRPKSELAQLPYMCQNSNSRRPLEVCNAIVCCCCYDGGGNQEGELERASERNTEPLLHLQGVSRAPHFNWAGSSVALRCGYTPQWLLAAALFSRLVRLLFLSPFLSIPSSLSLSLVQARLWGTVPSVGLHRRERERERERERTTELRRYATSLHPTSGIPRGRLSLSAREREKGTEIDEAARALAVALPHTRVCRHRAPERARVCACTCKGAVCAILRLDARIARNVLINPRYWTALFRARSPHHHVSISLSVPLSLALSGCLSHFPCRVY